MKIYDFIDQYNKLINDLLMNVEKSNKLKYQKISDLYFIDKFWKLDLSFKYWKRWILNSNIRKIINIIYHNLRMLEEIFILYFKIEWCYDWLIFRFDYYIQLFSIININLTIENEIFKVDLKTTDIMACLEDLVMINLNDDKKFKSIQEKLQYKLIHIYLC